MWHSTATTATVPFTILWFCDGGAATAKKPRRQTTLRHRPSDRFWVAETIGSQKNAPEARLLENELVRKDTVGCSYLAVRVLRPVYPIATDMWAVFASRSRICFCIHMNSLHPIVPKLLLLKPPWHLEMQSAHRRNQLFRNTSTNQKATNSNCLSPICFLSHVIATA